MSSRAAELVEVTFWGTRGSISTPGWHTEKYGGNTPCVSMKCGDKFFIFDAGTGIRLLGNELAAGGKAAGREIHLLLTHTHWDHIHGLPFFLPAYIKGTRLKIYGVRRTGGTLADILRKQMDYNYFPVDIFTLGTEIQVIELEKKKKFRFGDVNLKWEEQVYHPGGCLRYRLDLGGKRIVYATDVELDLLFGKSMPKEIERRHMREYLDFIESADLLIGDGQYTRAEYPQKATWGHSTIELLAELAYKARVKKLAVFHHDPDRSDRMIDELCRLISPRYEQARPAMQMFWAREGMTVPV